MLSHSLYYSGHSGIYLKLPFINFIPFCLCPKLFQVLLPELSVYKQTKFLSDLHI